MLNQTFRPLFILILTLVFICVGLSFAQASSLCVVSLLHEKQINQELPKEVRKHLQYMGHDLNTGTDTGSEDKDTDLSKDKDDDEASFFKFYGDLTGTREVYSALRACLEGDYEEVAIVAHSMKNPLGKPILIFPSRRMEGKASLSFLNDRFFARLNAPSKVQQVSVIGCNSEEVLPSYPNLLEYMSTYNINLKQAPSDLVLSEEKGTLRGRSFQGVVTMLAEAAQPMNSKILFCRVHFQTSDIYSCLRGHIEVEAMEESIYSVELWIRIRRDPEGFISSINFLGPYDNEADFQNPPLNSLPQGSVYEGQGYRISFPTRPLYEI